MKWHPAAAVCVVAVNTLAFASPAHPRITWIVITRVESPTFEGVAFGDTGPYEKIVGRAFGEIDPADPRNRACWNAVSQGHLYEFSYIAKDPLVAGLGFAALRDLAIFLRDAAADDDGAANPLAGDVERIYTFSVSQPARFVRDFNRLGFNESSTGPPCLRRQSDWIGGASGGFFNYRFAQPARTHRQHIGRMRPAVPDQRRGRLARTRRVGTISRYPV